MTVITERTGIGVQVDEVEELEEDMDEGVGIKVVVGVWGVGGVEGVEEAVGVYIVVGLSKVIDLRTGCCDVEGVDIVELVDGVYIAMRLADAVLQ